MKYLSLFSGIGGFELGIQQAYEKISGDMGTESTDEKSEQAEPQIQLWRERATVEEGLCVLPIDEQDGRSVCIGFSEIDKYATAIYQKHFPEHKNYGDITKLDPATLPDFDLLVGGFPCQAFSIAGKRKGFDDTRGTLFFDIARILQVKQPRLFLLENVKGLLSHDNGKTFSTIIATLDELGYDLQWQVLNSKNHGVPQNRERVFIVGHLRGTSRPQVFPFGEGSQIITQKPAEADLSESPTRAQSRNNILSISDILEKKTTEPAFDYESGEWNYSPPPIRRLTPTECERLQGFPDGWTGGLSDSQRYKCLGNAVTVNVIREIVLKILQSNQPNVILKLE